MIDPYPGRPYKRWAEYALVALALAVGFYLALAGARQMVERVVEQQQVDERCLQRPRKPLPEC